MARLEWRLQATSLPSWLLPLVLVAASGTINPLVLIPGGGQEIGGIVAHANSMYALAPSMAIATFFATPFLVAIIAGLGVIRDDDVQISELLRSSSLTLRQDVMGRCLGIGAVLLVALAIHALALIALRETGYGGATRGPFSFAAYVVPSLVFVLPSMIWTAGLAFALGALTRRPMAVYALPTLYSILMFAVFWNWRPDDMARWLDVLLVVFDPSGLRYLTHHLFATDRGFAHYNSAPLPLDGLLLANRLMTLAVPVAAVALVIARSGAARPVRPRASGVHSTTAPRPARAFMGLGNLTMFSGAPGFIAGSAMVLRVELRDTARQPSFFLFAALLLALIPEVAGAEPDSYGGLLVLSTGDAAVRLLPLVTVLVTLSLLVIVTESMHRDRATGFDAIVHATPVATGALLAGRALAAFVVATALTLGSGIVAGIVVGLQPGATVALAPLILVFAAVMLPTFVLWIAVVMLVSSTCRERTTALGVGLGALILTAAHFIGGQVTWLTNWPALGALRWTDFGIFPLHSPALVANRLLALGLAVAGFAAAGHFFVRRESDAQAARTEGTARRWARRVPRIAALALLPVVSGTFLALRLQPEIKTGQRPLVAVKGAEIRAIDVAVRLEPRAQQMIVQGTYLIANTSAEPLRYISLSQPDGAEAESWRLDGQSVTVLEGGRLPLRNVLAQGDTTRLWFRYIASVPNGLPRNGGSVSNYVHSSGVMLSTHRGVVLPTLHPDRDARFNDGVPFRLLLTVNAPRAFRVVAVGDQVDEVQEDDRTITTWTSPVSLSAITIAAAPYSITTGPGVAVYHLAEHQASADSIRSTLAMARSAYSEWFGPLPWRELRVVEHAELFAQATAYPSMIALSEAMGFKSVRGPSGDLAFAVTAHEAAHQWWGHLLHVDDSPGSGVLLEGLSDYAALRLHALALGQAARVAFAVQLEKEYLRGRSISGEPSLSAALDGTIAHEAVLQKKGAWVLWMMHQQVGADAMDRALRALLSAHPMSGAPAALNDLVDAVRREARDQPAFDRLVAQWVHTATLPEFSVDSAECARGRDGWRCSATLRNVGDGSASIDVATVVRGQLLAERRRVDLPAGGQSRLSWVGSERVDAIVIDPDAFVLQGARPGWRVFRRAAGVED